MKPASFHWRQAQLSPSARDSGLEGLGGGARLPEALKGDMMVLIGVAP